jgi:SHS family lactate transporter-like MFS transporter
MHFLHCNAVRGSVNEPAMTKLLPWWKEPTRAQWAAFAAAWVGWVLDAFDFTIYICVGGALIKEFGVTPTAVAGSLTLTLLVRLVGGFVAGWMADRWGRRLPLMMSLVWFAVFDAAIYFAPSFAWIIVFRTLFGFGMGAEWTAGTALAMEAFPQRTRKFASGLLQAGWPVGFLIASATAYFVVPAFGWRAMFLIAAVPALLVIPIRMFVPDELSQVAKAPESRGAVADLAAPQVRKMIILGSILMALGFVVYYGMVTTHMGLYLGAGLSQADGWLGMIYFNVGMLVGVVGAGMVASRFGVIAALVAPALLMVPALPLFVGSVPHAMPIGAFLGGMLGVGYSGVTPILTTSLFAPHVRARAIGVVYHVGALLAAFVPTLIPWLVSRTGMSLAHTTLLVVGIGLVAMSGVVIAVRKHITPPELEVSPTVVPVIGATDTPAATPAGRRELHPVAVAIVDREVAKAAERRALLG